MKMKSLLLMDSTNDTDDDRETVALISLTHPAIAMVPAIGREREEPCISH